MLEALLAIGGGLIVTLVVAVLARSSLRRGIGRGGRVKMKMPAPETAADVSLFGLAPWDVARFQQSAREQMHLEQARWGRDYLPGVSEGAMPGRTGSLPRSLRVRR